MKKILLSMVVLAAIALIPTSVNAQTESVAAGASIIAPISISETAALHFGTIAKDADGGSVVLSAAGVRTPTGLTLSTGTPTASAAAFSVGGESGLSYVITLPSAPITITHSGGAGTGTMSVGTFTSDIAGGVIGTDDTFSVGATLTVGADQATGTYSGTFNVSIAYN